METHQEKMRAIQTAQIKLCPKMQQSIKWSGFLCIWRQQINLMVHSPGTVLSQGCTWAQVRHTAGCGKCCHNSYTVIRRWPLPSCFQWQNTKRACYGKLQPLQGLSQNTSTMSQHAVRLEGRDNSPQPKSFFMALADDIVLRPISVGNLKISFWLPHSQMHLWAWTVGLAQTLLTGNNVDQFL